MKLLPEGVTATLPELIESIQFHFREIEHMEFFDFDKEQNKELQARLRGELCRSYLETFGFSTKLMDDFIKQNKSKNQIADDIAAE